jgi:hypothetical protein
MYTYSRLDLEKKKNYKDNYKDQNVSFIGFVNSLDQ